MGCASDWGCRRTKRGHRRGRDVDLGLRRDERGGRRALGRSLGPGYPVAKDGRDAFAGVPVPQRRRLGGRSRRLARIVRTASGTASARRRSRFVPCVIVMGRSVFGPDRQARHAEDRRLLLDPAAVRHDELAPRTSDMNAT